MDRSRTAVIFTAGVLLVTGLVLAGSSDDSGSAPQVDCSQTFTTPSGEVIDPSNSGCASMEIGLDGTCLVDFPVDDEIRRDLGALCPNGVEQR